MFWKAFAREKLKCYTYRNPEAGTRRVRLVDSVYGFVLIRSSARIEVRSVQAHAHAGVKDVSLGSVLLLFSYVSGSCAS